MRVRDRLLNGKEELVLRELNAIADDNAMRAFSLMRMSDVIDRETTRLSDRQFQFLTRAHFDFVITDKQTKPLMAVEYDGPTHRRPAQIERDSIKNELCREAGLGLLRINDRYFSKLYNGITLLRWIVETIEMEKAFAEAQERGSIPLDEPFSPQFWSFPGEGFRYWLSQNANQSFHDYFDTLDRSIPKGVSTFLGTGADGASHFLGCLYFGDVALSVQTAMKQQDVDFQASDLLDEIGVVELGELLKAYLAGRAKPMTRGQFEGLFKRWCEAYKTGQLFGFGAFPVEASWNGDAWSYGDGPGAFTGAVLSELNDPLAIEIFELASAESIFEQFEAISLRSPEGLADFLHVFDVQVDQRPEGFDPGHVLSCRGLAGIDFALDTSRPRLGVLLRYEGLAEHMTLPSDKCPPVVRR